MKSNETTLKNNTPQNFSFIKLAKKMHKQTIADRIRPTKALVLAIPYVLLTLFLLIIPLVSILIRSFMTTGENENITTVANNWEVVTQTIGMKIFNSLWISVIAALFCIIIAYPFAYFLSISKSALLKTVAVALITSPIWMSMLVKLIGLKTFFDVVNNEVNSTHGHIFTIIGLVYIYLPFMILPLYTSLTTMPKNLVNASYDLGRGFFYTFFKIIIPYTKNALISGTTIVFLSSFTSVAIAEFLNNDNSASLIGEEILKQGQGGISNQIQLARASTLTLIISLILIGLYIIIVVLPKLVKWILKRVKQKGENNAEI